MVKCGLNTVFFVFPVEFNSTWRSKTFTNLKIIVWIVTCLKKRANFAVNSNLEYVPQFLKSTSA